MIYASRHLLDMRARLLAIAQEQGAAARIRILIVLLPILLVGTLYTACTRDDDSEQIRMHIAEGVNLAEAHAIGDLLQLATKDLRAMPMNLDRRGVKGVLWQAFKHYGAFTVLYPRPTIAITADAREATTQFPFLIIKKGNPIPGLEKLRDNPMAWIDAVGDAADLYHLRLQWIKKDGDWRVDLAWLERFEGTEFE